jgi:hypothetical protein
MLLSVVQTYGRTIGRMLCKPYRGMYVGPLDLRYFLEYPLVNTWTFEATIEPLGKNHRTNAPWLDVCYFLGL